tara:strand:- start:427 stop:540 length:114 start_codon:yes stop_codon:yes gene_type:complete
MVLDIYIYTHQKKRKGGEEEGKDRVAVRPGCSEADLQ